MTEMTMRERVARALCDAQGLRWDDQKNYATSANGDEDDTEFYFVMADAAIAAMREPSEAMVNKAWAMIGSNLRYEEVYRHLIDAALSDKPTA